MKIKNVLKRALSLALAVLMTISAIPAITTEVSAATTLTGHGIDALSITYTGSDGGLMGGSYDASFDSSTQVLTSSATGYKLVINLESSVTLKFTNNSSKSGELSFDYTIIGSPSSSTLSTSATHYNTSINGNGYCNITLKAKGPTTATYKISNIKFVLDVETHFAASPNGS